MFYVKLVRSTPRWKSYLSATAAKTCCDWLVLWIFNVMVRSYSRGREGGSPTSPTEHRSSLETMIVIWVIARLTSRVISESYYVRIKNDFDAQILLAFREQALAQYEALNFPTRKVEPLSTYLPRFRNSMSFIKTICGMGSNAILSLLRAVFDVRIAVGDVPPLATAVTALLAGTFYFASRKVRALHIMQRHRRDKEERLTNDIKMEEPYFEQGVKDRHALLNLHRDFSSLSGPVLDTQQAYSSVLSMGVECIILAVVLSHFHFDTASLNVLNILRSVLSMASSISSCSKFHRKYVDEESNMIKYLEFWKLNEKNKITPAEKHPWPSQLTCTDINFHRVQPPYSMSLAAPFTLPQGAKVLLRGDTGSGKSTLCELIQGRDLLDDLSRPAMTFAEGNQRCFAHHIIECPQDSSAGIKFDTSTIRDHFNKDTDDSQILKFCEIVSVQQKVSDLGLDSHINKRISGGEKQRITLASILHHNIVVNKQVRCMIFDEPEKGLGRAAPKIISNIINFADYKDTTILVSSHHTDLETLGFTHIIDVSKSDHNAVVSVVSVERT